MELLKNIFFNTDKLVQNTTVKISYTGKFFEDGSEETHIHYGFGENWENLAEVEMEKTELGYQCEVDLPTGYDTFNFCFKNENGEWDNNNNENYVFEIETPCTDLTVTESTFTLARTNRLRKSYLWGKKIKIVGYKILHFVSKLFSGNVNKGKVGNVGVSGSTGVTGTTGNTDVE